MIRKFRYGAPFNTEALTEEIETADGAFPYGKIRPCGSPCFRQPV